MIELSLLEKIGSLFSLVFSTPLFLILLLCFLLMIIDMYFISKQKKNVEIIYAVLSVVIVIVLLQNYFESLGLLFNELFKNIISLIYFPSILEYIIILLVGLLILLVSVISKKISKRIKIVNAFVYAVNTFLFFLILDQITKNKIDLSNQISIYSNKNLMVLFELSMIIFALWIIGLILYKIIMKLINGKAKEEKLELPKLKENFYEEPELPKTMEELRGEDLKFTSTQDIFTLDEYKKMKSILEKTKDSKKQL